MPIRPAAVLFALTAFCFLSSPTRAADPGGYDHKLLLAQIEGLQQRLACREPLAGLEATGPGLQVELLAGRDSRREAGSSLVRQPVRLRGQAQAVLEWLALAARRGLAGRSPLSARGLPGRGRPVELELTLWRLGAEPFDPKAPEPELIRLRDNLLWLEAQLRAVGPLLAMMETLLDTETVRLERLDYQDGRLALQARAVDPLARQAFEQALDQGIGRLPHPPGRRIEIRTPAAAPAGPEGLNLAGAPAGDALLLVASMDQTEVLIVDGGRPSPDGLLAETDPDRLLVRLAERLGLRLGRFGAVRVLAPELSAAPAAAREAGAGPVELVLRQADPRQAWRQVAAAASLGVLARPQPERRLSAVLRRRPAAQVAGLLAWAQGLALRRLGPLLVALPAADPPPAADARAGERALGLTAVDAPLAALVAGLLDGRPVVDCAPAGRGLDLRIARVGAGELLGGLLAAGDRRLALGAGQVRLLPATGAPASDPTACRPAEANPGELRLAALLRDPKGRGNRALVAEGGRFRWLGRGDGLADGRRVLRVRRNRVLLGGPAGRPQQLDFGSRPEALGRPLPPGPGAVGLAELRLAATCLLPGHPARAVVEVAGSGGFLVGPGDSVGRRCGRIEAVLPDRLRIHQLCPRGAEPAEVELLLSPD